MKSTARWMKTQGYPHYQLKLHPSSKCNLACAYCFREKESTNEKMMDFKTAKDAIDFLVNSFGPDGRKYTVDLSGSGEALFNFQLITEVTEYCKTLSQDLRKEILISFITNGTLLNEQHVDYLKKNQVLFGISIDGGKQVQDAIRVYPNGRGSYDQIIDNLKKLKDPQKMGFGVTLTGKHCDVKSIFLDLYNLGFSDAISIRPVRLPVENEYAINQQNIDQVKKAYTDFVQFLLEKALAGETDYLWSVLRGADYLGRYIERIVSGRFISRRCSAGLNSFSVNNQGDIYACPVLIGHGQFKLGNIYDGIDRERQDYFRKITVDEIASCKECPVKYVCGGECFVVSEIHRQELGQPQEIMCEYKKHLIKLSMTFLNEVRAKAPDLMPETAKRCVVKGMYNISDPGIACLHQLLSAYEITAEFNQLRVLANTGDYGTTPFGLVKAAESLGLPVKTIKVEADSLLELGKAFGFPMIAYMGKVYYTDYYVVLLGITDEYVEIFDPFGGGQKIDRTEFIQFWSGVLMIPQVNYGQKVI